MKVTAEGPANPMTLAEARRHISFRPAPDEASKYAFNTPGLGWNTCSSGQDEFLDRHADEHVSLGEIYIKAGEPGRGMALNAFRVFIIKGVLLARGDRSYVG